jgi:Flp pilus assembly protein TadB
MTLIIVSFGAVAVLATYAVIQGEKEKKVKKQFASLWKSKTSKEIREAFQIEKHKDTPNKVLLRVLDEKAEKREQLEKIRDFNYGGAITSILSGTWKIVTALFRSLIPAVGWTLAAGLCVFIGSLFTHVIFLSFDGIIILFFILFGISFLFNLFRMVAED